MSRMFKGARSRVIQAVRCSMRSWMVSGRAVMLCRRGAFSELFAAELRRPFFEESANPFAAVLGKIAGHLFLDLALKRGSEFYPFTSKQCSFDLSDRQRRPLRYFLGERLHFGFELGG